VTPGAGTIKLSLPSTLTLSDLAPNSFVRTNASKALETVTANANGQLLIGSASGIPTLAMLSPGNGIGIVNGANSIRIDNEYMLNTLSAKTYPTQTLATSGLTNSNLNWASASTGATTGSHSLNWTGQLAVPNGGTGAATFASGRLLQGNTTSAISEFPLGTANQVLGMSNAATPVHQYKTITGGTNIAIDATTTAGVIKVSATGIAALTIFRTTITIPEALNLGQGSSFDYTVLLAPTTPIIANSTVILNPRTSLTNGTVISHVYIPSLNRIVVGITSTKNQVDFAATTFDVTVIY